MGKKAQPLCDSSGMVIVILCTRHLRVFRGMFLCVTCRYSSAEQLPDTISMMVTGISYYNLNPGLGIQYPWD